MKQEAKWAIFAIADACLIVLWLVNGEEWAKAIYLSIAWTTTTAVLISVAVIHMAHAFGHSMKADGVKLASGLILAKKARRVASIAVLLFAGQFLLAGMYLAAIVAVSHARIRELI